MQGLPGNSRLLFDLRLRFQVVKNALRLSHPERLGIILPIHFATPSANPLSLSFSLGLRGSLIADPIPFATAPTCGPKYSAILGPAVHINNPVKIVPNNAYTAFSTWNHKAESHTINAPVKTRHPTSKVRAADNLPFSSTNISLIILLRPCLPVCVQNLT